jgi:hypothetical protein
MSKSRLLSAVGAVGLLLALAATPTAHGQADGTVTIQMGPGTGQSVGVLSEISGNWGTDASTDTLPFGNYVGLTSGRLIQTRAYLLFPLSAIPAGATVTSAALQVYVNDWPFNGSAELGVYCVAAPWSESLNWATQPAADGTLRASTGVSSIVGWVSWDVTSPVQAWQSGASNHGFMLGGAPTPDAMVSNGWAAAAVGRTAGDAARAPRLVVSYSFPYQVGPADIPEPGTALLLAGGLAALAGYVRLRRS